MVLVYLKNLVFPSAAPRLLYESKRHDLETGRLPSVDLRNASDDSQISWEDEKHSLISTRTFSQSPPSSISGDTMIESTSRTFRIDPRIISDATIGLSDGLTVPFALTAGLSALGDTKVVIFGGLAELTAGAISMGMGGYLAAKSEVEAYESALASTRHLVKTSPSSAASLIRNTLGPYFPPRSVYQPYPSHATQYGPESEPLEALLDNLVCNPEQLVECVMRFHHSLTPPSDTRSASVSALTIAASYFLGGFLPLLPYFFANAVGTAFWWSVGVMAVALFLFGAAKTWLTTACEEGHLEFDAGVNRDGVKEKLAERKQRKLQALLKCAGGGMQMMVLGGVAASASVGLVKVFSS